jgi:DNA invertase Pin-like site-specific DNA recombinase
VFSHEPCRKKTTCRRKRKTSARPKKPALVPVAILGRVSTAKQETDRQVFELREVAEKAGWDVVEVIEEQISGNAADWDRAGINRAVELAKGGSIQKVLVHEVSRIARRNSTSHRFVEDLEALGVSLYWHAQRIETLLASGRRNPAASIMFSLLAEMARNERETLVERIMSGLAEARRKGQRLGRPPGSVVVREEFLAKHRDVIRQRRAGQSTRNAAKITNKGVSTVQRVKATLNG